jgi:hypothetical protein
VQRIVEAAFDAEVFKGSLPGLGVESVAVDQGAVDIA